MRDEGGFGIVVMSVWPWHLTTPPELCRSVCTSEIRVHGRSRKTPRDRLARDNDVEGERIHCTYECTFKCIREQCI